MLPRVTRVLGSLRRPRVAWCAAFAIGLAVASTARLANAEGSPQGRYAGTFHYAGGEHERHQLEHAIEQVARDSSWIKRPFVRQRLKQRAGVAPWVTFSFPPGSIKTVIPGHAPVLSPESGAQVTYQFDGENVRASQRFQGERLLQVFRAPEGTRTNEYVPTGQSEGLVLHVTLESPELPEPLHYTLTYRR